MTVQPSAPPWWARTGSSSAQDTAVGALAIGLLVFGSALLGIFTRPQGSLAAFWIANAVLLGVLVRRPDHANLPTACAAAVGFVAADFITGGSWPKVGWLTLANLVGVGVGFALFSRLSPEHRRLRQPLSMVYFIVIAAAASFAAGLVGMVINPILFDGSPADGMLLWFTADVVDYLVILPAILTMPSLRQPRHELRRRVAAHVWDILKLAPVLALLLGAVLGIVISGPGAIAYLVPGLLWCALTYSLFVTALLTLLCSAWTLVAVSFGWLHLGADFAEPYALQSFRIGVALMTLAPLTVASVMAARNELLSALQHSASHDLLTGVLNRGGLIERAELLLSGLRSSRRPAAMMMLDIDHFKNINDTQGHAAGDRVLAEVAQLAASSLRESDLIGRMGGEEFAILVPDCSESLARAIAQRICEACASAAVEGSPEARTTVSIGVAHADWAPGSVDEFLLAADAAMYRAKQAGRNRVVVEGV